ncbi:MAG: TraE/TraK family type IV conjugative transfer system protein [Candidatus Competibacteraceae bacterium]
MNLHQYLQTWQGTRRENHWSRLIILLLVVSNGLAWLDASRENTTVVLTPPTLNEAVKVARQSADANYQMAWGLFVAQLLGNVTPGSTELILNALEPLLAPAIYQPVHDAVAEQLASLRQEQVTLAFSPRQTQYDSGADRVYVSGTLTTTGVSGTAQRSERTYEMRFTIKDYRPQLTQLTAYSGPPKKAERAP